MDIEFQTHVTFPHGDLLDDRACSDDVNTAQVYGFPYVIRTVGDLFELTGKSVRRSGEPHLFGKHSGRCALLVGKKNIRTAGLHKQPHSPRFAGSGTGHGQ